MIKKVFSTRNHIFTFEEDSLFYSSHRISLILVLTLVTAAGAHAQEVASQWQLFTPPEGDFSVLTPAPLESEGPTTVTPGTKGLRYEAVHGGNVYIVTVTVGTFGTLATGVTASFMKGFTSGFERSLCSQISESGRNCRLANESASSRQGVPMRQYSLLLNEGEVGVVRIMFGVKRIYLYGAIGNPLNHPDGTRFLDSFTIRPVALSEMMASPPATGDPVKEERKQLAKELNELGRGQPATGDPVKEALERGARSLAARRYEEAEREFRQALSLNPREARAFVGLGNIRHDQQQYEEAVEAFRQAIRIDPNFADAHYNLGVLYSNRGITYSLLVDSNSILKKYEAFGQARDAFQQAARINPNFADAHYNLGIVHRALYKDKEAAEAFRRAVDLYQRELILDPNNVAVRYHLGLASLWSGNRTGALEQYRVLQRLNSFFANKLMAQINRQGGPTQGRRSRR